MTVTDKYFLSVNKKSIIFDIFAIVVLSGIMGDTPTIGITYYLCRIGVYMYKFIYSGFSLSNSNDSRNLILIIPFTRKMIFKTYVNMLTFLIIAFLLYLVF